MVFGIGVLVVGFLATTIPTKKGKSMDWMQGVSAHRGCFTKDQTIAENSMSAFKVALNKKMDIELDVRITKDNHLVVFHDRTLTRMCNVSLDVEEETLETLKQYKLGQGNDVMSTFDEVLAAVDGQVNLIIEIKPTEKVELVSKKVAEALDHYVGNYAICSFDPKILRWFKQHRNHFIRGQIIKSYLTDKRHNLLNRLLLTINGYNFFTRTDYISVEYPLVLSYVWMRKVSAFVCVWSISDTDVFKTLKPKVDHLITEFIEC